MLCEVCACSLHLSGFTASAEIPFQLSSSANQVCVTCSLSWTPPAGETTLMLLSSENHWTRNKQQWKRKRCFVDIFHSPYSLCWMKNADYHHLLELKVSVSCVKVPLSSPDEGEERRYLLVSCCQFAVSCRCDWFFILSSVSEFPEA